jgi:hypothetical protein
MTQAVAILAMKPLPRTVIVCPPTPEVGFRTIRGSTLKETPDLKSPELPVTLRAYVWFMFPAGTTNVPVRTPVLPVTPHE